MLRGDDAGAPDRLRYQLFYELRIPMGWYLRCHSRTLWPTKIRACPTPILSSRSLSYSSTKALELGCPRSIFRASSSVVGAGTSSTPLVFGLYQCILLLSQTRSRPSLRPQEVRLTSDKTQLRILWHLVLRGTEASTGWCMVCSNVGLPIRSIPPPTGSAGRAYIISGVANHPVCSGPCSVPSVSTHFPGWSAIHRTS